ncbi:hypothetical protein PCANC_26056 [Puccinia coronata f. sp. avenae]|uniref:Integrase catalytic domain-containing protein n=1 Tax=Puccinia coronata f. sp. avenae TaxID=200324 RepID=A0A2N5TVK7_9BASI|nr:hypothetical protein PCANC_26056 [Puccinia coronata f. sp. avenae]
MVYQAGKSLSDHIKRFKAAYTALIEQTASQRNDFGTVTSYMATALFLQSLENDTELTAVIQTCCNLKPFNLKLVTNCVQNEAFCQINRAENVSTVMFTSGPPPQSQSKNAKKKSKQSDGLKPKAVAPTLNPPQASTVSSSKPGFETSAQPKKLARNHLISLTVKHLSPQFTVEYVLFARSIPNIHSITTISILVISCNKVILLIFLQFLQFQRLENTVGEIAEFMKKLSASNMLGMVHSSEPVSTSSSGVFDYNSERSAYFISTIQHASREYFSRFLVFDTGATQACVMNLKLLHNLEPLNGHFLNTFSSPIKATHSGTLKVGDFHISPVYFVPSGCANVISATQLLDHGLKPQFKTDQFLIKNGDKIFASFARVGKLFLTPVSEYINVVNMSIPDIFDWHFALGHASDKYVELFIKHNNLKHSNYTVSATCKVCMHAKIHRSPHSRKLLSSAMPFHRVHTDVLQLSPVSKYGYKYVLVIVNDASRFNRIYLLKAKSESESKLLEFCAELKNKINRVPAYLHSDCGGKFSSLSFLAKLKEFGVSIERGPADSLQTNGVAKQFNGVLLEKGQMYAPSITGSSIYVARSGTPCLDFTQCTAPRCSRLAIPDLRINSP